MWWQVRGFTMMSMLIKCMCNMCRNVCIGMMNRLCACDIGNVCQACVIYACECVHRLEEMIVCMWCLKHIHVIEGDYDFNQIS